MLLVMFCYVSAFNVLLTYIWFLEKIDTYCNFLVD
ncbi:hypothetical protein BDD26_3220 [Xenorhabdus cabanillasii]|uniref:Uncharacterized protein n=1 Tax=Xenorhabdus cabanillasii TaxID=351673 RepID=A0A3D9UFT3_9GAMM|nr:hypothetical protein BDD26_3220 [Xenorhabdus cabanillasii]